MPHSRTQQQIAAHLSWAGTVDRSARVLPAKRAFEDRFERQVDPDGRMTPQDRAKAAENARKAYYLALSLKGVEARRRRQEAAS